MMIIQSNIYINHIMIIVVFLKKTYTIFVIILIYQWCTWYDQLYMIYHQYCIYILQYKWPIRSYIVLYDIGYQWLATIWLLIYTYICIYTCIYMYIYIYIGDTISFHQDHDVFQVIIYYKILLNIKSYYIYLYDIVWL